MSPASGTAVGAPWYRQFWPWFLIALPAASVALSAIALVLALRHPDALVRDDYYDAGLAINRVFARERVAAGRRLVARLSVEAGTLAVELTGAHAAETDVLVLELQHPTLADRDQRLLLRRTGPGRFAVAAALPAGGWNVALGPEGAAWRLAGRLDLSRPGPHVLRAAPERS